VFYAGVVTGAAKAVPRAVSYDHVSNTTFTSARCKKLRSRSSRKALLHEHRHRGCTYKIARHVLELSDAASLAIRNPGSYCRWASRENQTLSSSEIFRRETRRTRRITPWSSRCDVTEIPWNTEISVSIDVSCTIPPLRASRFQTPRERDSSFDGEMMRNGKERKPLPWKIDVAQPLTRRERFVGYFYSRTKSRRNISFETSMYIYATCHVRASFARISYVSTVGVDQRKP